MLRASFSHACSQVALSTEQNRRHVQQVSIPGAAPLLHRFTALATPQVRAGRWLASLNLAGELYQGFFSTEQEAAEAIVLSGFTQPAVSA